MFEEKVIKMPITSINATTGLVSALEIIDTTLSGMFAKIRDDTSETEMQRIIYPSIRLLKGE